MILVPSIKRIAVRVTAAAMAAATLLTSVAYADEPYTGYNYDWWGDPVPSQNGYVVDKVYTGADMGVDALSEPSDMFFSETEDLFIADTAYKPSSGSGKGRIVVTDKNFSLKYTIESLDMSGIQEWLDTKQSELNSGAISQADFNKVTSPAFNGPNGEFLDYVEGA